MAKNAKVEETTVSIDIAGKEFFANFSSSIQLDYLEIYNYEKWNNSKFHKYIEKDVFNPTSIEMLQHSTWPPNLLTQSELIELMSKNGICQDSNYIKQIQIIEQQEYIFTKENKFLISSNFGKSLVKESDEMGIEITKPYLITALENDLTL